MNEATAVQLRLLREIAAGLDAARVRWWLFGGWAMDAHAGEVTRDHSDIEIYAWVDDADAARAALLAAGFAAPPGLHPAEGQPFIKEGQEAGLWYLTRNERGEIITPGRWADWPWHPGSFEGPSGQIGDLRLPVMSLEGLLDIKSNFARHRHGAPLRDKDVADIERLRRMIAARGGMPPPPRAW